MDYEAQLLGAIVAGVKAALTRLAYDRDGEVKNELLDYCGAIDDALAEWRESRCPWGGTNDYKN